MIGSTAIWRCTTCGNNKSYANHCPCCGAPVCDNCGATNSMMNVVNMRLVSDKKPLPARDLKNKPKDTKKKKYKKKRDLRTELAELGIE